MTRLQEIHDILGQGKLAAFQYEGGTEPNRLRIVYGAEDNCLMDLEDNCPKAFKEEKIWGVMEADEDLRELFDICNRKSRYSGNCLDAYNYGHSDRKLELNSDSRLSFANNFDIVTVSTYNFVGLIFRNNGRKVEIGLEFGKHILRSDALGAQKLTLQNTIEALQTLGG